MRKIPLYIYVFLASLVIITFCSTVTVTAQITPTHPINIPDTLSSKEIIDYKSQRDLIDLAYKVLHKDPDTRVDSTGNKNTRLYYSVAPIVEFTIATGFSPGIA